MSFLLRLALPDRPGALGAVATAIGAAGADILSVDIVERAGGVATDDMVVEMPPDRLADSLVSAAASVEGVRVESIRPYAGLIDPFSELELIEKLAADVDGAATLLADGICRLFRGSWALILGEPAPAPDGAAAAAASRPAGQRVPPPAGPARVLARSSAAPEIESLPAPWWPPIPPRQLSTDPDWAPPDWAALETELAVVPLGRNAILIGRPALRWLASEIIRMSHLASIAATVVDPG